MDVIDQSDEQARPVMEAQLAEVRQRKQLDNVPQMSGECENCGEDSLRLVRCNHPKDGPVWACCPCRDKYKLPVLR